MNVSNGKIDNIQVLTNAFKSIKNLSIVMMEMVKMENASKGKLKVIWNEVRKGQCRFGMFKCLVVEITMIGMTHKVGMAHKASVTNKAVSTTLRGERVGIALPLVIKVRETNGSK